MDSGSTDNTESIARRYSTRYEKRKWTGFSDQKNYGNELAQSNWILSLDADEEVTDRLRAEIETILSKPGERAAFSVPRKTFYAGRWIRHGGWYPNRVVRLFDKRFGLWKDLPVHEYWHTDQIIEALKTDLNHFSFTGVADQVERNNRYSSLGTMQLSQVGTPFSFSKMAFKPVLKFLETYIWKRGFLDGYLGLIISVSASYSVFLKWAKLWELNEGETKN